MQLGHGTDRFQHGPFDLGQSGDQHFVGQDGKKRRVTAAGDCREWLLSKNIPSRMDFVIRRADTDRHVVQLLAVATLDGLDDATKSIIDAATDFRPVTAPGTIEQVSLAHELF
jgi:hypothetical protein